MIDLSKVTVLNADRACLGFTRSAQILTWGLVPGRMSIRSRGTEGWPLAFPDDPGDGAAGTLWLFLNIGGTWFASGAENLRKSQLNGDKPEVLDPGAGDRISNLVGGGWFTNDKFQNPIAGYNPQPGEAVGLMLTSGMTRLNNLPTIRQRSNVLVIAWPNDSGANPCRVLWDEATSQPVPEPIPEPTPQPTPTPTPGDMATLFRMLATVKQSIDEADVANERRYKDLVARFEELKALTKAPRSGSARIPYLGSAPTTLDPLP